ncbi:glutamate receptor ionotropic, kainate 5-like isoform X2 [Zootermopsis nevadensis]|uniref:glutamate receptor ionotropic, kainate 5-like isoform X2 n=1 Tax=Zootermopsis nevadensis TaxID=136037 RepID=UPI000B8E6203|nr:glutamate receptor ionotropic, kainate 5-like isoform X2 [Zootermopsis nevadensis]
MRLLETPVHFILATLLIISRNGNSAVLGPVPVEYRSMADCLTTVSGRYFPAGHTLVFSWNSHAEEKEDLHGAGTWEVVETSLLARLHLSGRWPILASRTTDGRDRRHPLDWGDKHGSYVMAVLFQNNDEERALRHARNQIEELACLPSWNPRARFVIVMTGQDIRNSQRGLIKVILKELSDKQVLNAIVLLRPSKPFSDLHVLTWFPFTPPSGRCGSLKRVITVDAWMSDSREFSLNKDLFSRSVPKNLGSCPVKVSTSHFPPFVIYPDKSDATISSVGGVEIDMLRHISEAMNFSVVLPPRADATDSKLENGTWTGPIGDLLYRRSDLALGAWCFTLEDSLKVDGTNSYFAEEFTWFIPRAEMYPRFLSISRVFAPDVWLLVFVAMLFAGVLFHVAALTQTARESDGYKHFTKCLFNAWSVVLGVGVHEMPRSDVLRGIFCVWLTYALAINTVFQTYVTSYLVDPGHRHQIDSVEEVIESGSEVFVADFLQDFLSDDLLNQLRSWRNCGSAKQCLAAASRSPGVVVLSGKVFAEYDAGERSDAFDYHESSRDFLHSHIVMVLKKGSPFLDQINDVIRRLVEGGFPAKFYKDIVSKTKLKLLPEYSDEYVPMSVPHLQSAFVAMFVGTSLSLVLLACELLLKRTQAREQT